MAEVWRMDGLEPPRAPDGAGWVTAVWPREGKTLRLVLLGDSILGVPFHWVPAGPEACRGRDCARCAAGQNPRGQWYVAAYDRARRADVILVLPAGAAATLRRTAEDHGRLRGLSVVLRREGCGPRSRYFIDVEADLSEDPKLRSTFDLPAAVARLFRVETLPLLNEGGQP